MWVYVDLHVVARGCCSLRLRAVWFGVAAAQLSEKKDKFFLHAQQAADDVLRLTQMHYTGPALSFHLRWLL